MSIVEFLYRIAASCDAAIERRGKCHDELAECIRAGSAFNEIRRDAMDALKCVGAQTTGNLPVNESNSPSKLTVIFRNDAPMVHCGDCPQYRTVQVLLTPEQRSQLKSQEAWSDCNGQHFEEISRSIVEWHSGF